MRDRQLLLSVTLGALINKEVGDGMALHSYVKRILGGSTLIDKSACL